MKTKIKKNTPILVYLIVSILIAIIANQKGIAQNASSIIFEPTILFKWDGLQDENYYPAHVSIERLDDDEIFIKEYQYSRIIPTQKIGLPSIEKVNYMITRDIYKFLMSQELSVAAEDLVDFKTFALKLEN